MIKYSRGNCIQWNVTYAMNMSKHFLNKNHLRIVYYSLIHPHLTYALQKYIRKLEILQKKAVRAITCSKYNTPSSPLFKQLNILKLKDSYELQVEILIYDFVNQRLPDPLLDLYSYHGDSHDHETRHSTDLKPPATNSELMRRSFLYKKPLLWLSLSNSIRSSSSKYTFKNKITQGVISTY